VLIDFEQINAMLHKYANELQQRHLRWENAESGEETPDHDE